MVHFEVYGHQDAARTKPMRRDSIFLQASMTKPITSVAAMMLVEEGKMKLSDPIADFLPELANLKVELRRDGQPTEDVAPSRQPRVQDLLRHSAGFVYADSAPSARMREMYNSLNIAAADAPMTGDEMLRRLATIPLAHQPGTMFHYSVATDVLGLLVERVAGMPLDRFFVQRITGPLGMKDTAWFVPAEKRDRLAEALDSDPLKARMWRAYRIMENEAPILFQGRCRIGLHRRGLHPLCANGRQWRHLWWPALPFRAHGELHAVQPHPGHGRHAGGLDRPRLWLWPWLWGALAGWVGGRARQHGRCHVGWRLGHFLHH